RAGRGLFDLRPAGAGVPADGVENLLGDLVVVELGLVLDREPFAFRPDQVERGRVLLARPARLLHKQARTPVALTLDVKERVADPLPGAGNLAPLVLVVDQGEHD